MNIQRINFCDNHYQITRKQKFKKTKYNSGQTITSKKNYAYNINFLSRTIPQLYEEYNWYIYNDRVPAINSFLKISEKQDVMDKFLTEILKTNDRSYEFFDSFIYRPRETNSYIEKLKNKIGANSPNLLYFLPESSYLDAYTRYIDNKFLNEKSLISLLKIRPDWRGDVLLEKYKKLYNSDKLQIGNIPKEFPSNHLEKITNYLQQEMEEGLKTKKVIPPLTLDNRKYKFAYFTEGKSDKNVFGVFTPEGKKYVIKMGKPEMKSLDAPFALGTLAKIDFYLTTHRCRNSAPLCYYNHEKNFSIYKYIEHVHVNEDTGNISTISKHINDFKALGLNYNDTVGYKNFFKLTSNSTDGISSLEGIQDGINQQEWISVDNDHVTYNNRLQPTIKKYHAPLPNAMQMFL